jgi:hypothetical protein
MEPLAVNLCDDSDAKLPWPHVAPFYTVQVVAIENGPGSRKAGHQRIVRRVRIRRLCLSCLATYRINVPASLLFTDEARDPAAD